MATSSAQPDGRTESPSLAEAVYHSLRTAILHGTYRPNQRLVEADIAVELGASRTPVREALQRLGNDGLIAKSRHGWIVREFTVSEIREIYEIRAALEGYAARLAAQRARDEDIKALSKLIVEQRRLTARPHISRPAVVDLNDRFHDAVIAAAGNMRLDELVKANRTYYFNYQVAALYSDEQTIKSLEDHAVLCEAISARNFEKAELLARDHIGLALTLIEQQRGSLAILGR